MEDLANGNTKFNYTHAFLSNKLTENCGVLHASDIKELIKKLEVFVSFGPLNSKYKYNLNDSNFSIINMSLSDFEGKVLGDSKILYDEQLEYGFKIDIQNSNSNTFNKLILGKYSSNVKQMCISQRDVLLKEIIKNIKKIGKIYHVVYPGINIDYTFINNYEKYLCN